MDVATNSTIRSFIVKKFPAARKKVLGDDTPLLDTGIIDSLGILDIVAFLECSFNITVLDDELTPENFATISNICYFIGQKRFKSGLDYSLPALD